MIYTPEIARHIDLLRQRGYEDLLHKHLVFTITTGRSGTQTLCDVLACAKETCSLHEPAPAYSQCLRRVQRNADLALEFLIEEKLPAILASGMPCYVETSHLMCKGFIEPLLELGLRPHFLLVHRDARSVAKSFVQLNSIPERTQLGREFMLSPSDPCLLELPCWDDFTDYQLCYWYALEIRRRIQWYAALFDRFGIQYTWFDFADFRYPNAVFGLIGACGLVPYDDALARIAQILTQPTNGKSQDKANAGRQSEVSDPIILEHAELVVARACKASVTDDYLSRLTVVRSKAA